MVVSELMRSALVATIVPSDAGWTGVPARWVGVDRGTVERFADHGSTTKMQILNESSTEQDAHAVGTLSPDRPVALSAAQCAHARRAISGGRNGRRLTSEREAQIRQRVLSGAYSAPAFIDELARRIIRSGDL